MMSNYKGFGVNELVKQTTSDGTLIQLDQI